MAKPRQLAIVRRLRGRRRHRTRIGSRVPLLFAAIIILAMAMDMCAFPPSRRNVVLAESCLPTPVPSAGEGADGRTAKTSGPVEKEAPCQ